MDDALVSFRYEGLLNGVPVFCVFVYGGKEYRYHYSTILEMTNILHRVPDEVSDYILFWCAMIYRPD